MAMTLRHSISAMSSSDSSTPKPTPRIKCVLLAITQPVIANRKPKSQL